PAPRQPPGAPPFPYTTLFRSAAIIKDDPRAQEFTEAWKKDIREELQGDETKFSVTEALKRARQRQQGGTRRPRRSQQKQDPKQRSEEHTSELQSRENLVCRLL